jgi:hypothetical protein
MKITEETIGEILSGAVEFETENGSPLATKSDEFAEEATDAEPDRGGH